MKSPTPLSSLDHIPREVLCAADYEPLAEHFVAAATYAYIRGGSGHDVTLRANRVAFATQAITPRILCDMSGADTRLDLLGYELAHPLLLAPVAFQRLVHPHGEVETARAAAATDSCMVVSTLASTSLEDIAAQGPRRWFQLYLQPEPDATRALLRRARAAGYEAIVLTLDAAVQAPSFQAQRAGFRMPSDVIAVNTIDLPQADAVPPPIGESRIFSSCMRHAPTWTDLEWLLAETPLPVLVKGVLHPDDARRLKALGVAGIVVSNHGGRSLDGAPASLTVLPAIRDAVGDDYPLLFDGGIRSGSDIFKALARGADAVLTGRLQVYALSVAGALGVAHLIKLLREELELCMALTGCTTLAAIRTASLTPFAENH